MVIFGDRLKLLRNRKGLSQAEFAKQIGVSKSSVNMYERGDREPNFETLEAIADYFNVDLDYLMGKSEIENRAQFTYLEKNQAQTEVIPFKPDNRNVLRLAGRDGSYLERTLTDDQLKALTAILDQMPDASNDL